MQNDKIWLPVQEPQKSKISKTKRGPKPLRETSPELERKKRVSVYLNHAEVSVIAGFASITMTSPAKYLRYAGLKTPPILIPAINQEAWSRLSSVAANLNQLCRRLNCCNHKDNASLLDVLQLVYRAGNTSLQSIAKALEAEGVVVLSAADGKILADFRQALIGARQ